ncbi:MAG: cell wall hydrolase [Betaproteobacteria bacterium]|nr:cell wall hydrolase [Betaproteobacteria bacterium]
MSLRYFVDELAFRAASAWADARRGVRLFWYRADREAMAFALIIGAVLVAFGYGLHAVFTRHERVLELVREAERADIECLARNVYFEARGEPPEGQYAVAEVTMNRKASRRYPATVCAVVHEKRWDAIRKRYVGAFSWTEFYSVPEPSGEAWEFAQKVAADVYHRRAPERVEGATYFHAHYVKPSWAKQQERISRIGRHVFYR